MSRSLGRCQAGAEGKRTRHPGEELEMEKDRSGLQMPDLARVVQLVISAYKLCINLKSMWSSLYGTTCNTATAQ